MSEIMHCWPKEWLNAAVECGLAVPADDHITIIGGDEMRAKLERFATLICESMDDDE